MTDKERIDAIRRRHADITAKWLNAPAVFDGKEQDDQGHPLQHVQIAITTLNAIMRDPDDWPADSFNKIAEATEGRLDRLENEVINA